MLTPEQVAEIKASSDSGVALAARYKVTPTRISQIRGLMPVRKLTPEEAKARRRDAVNRWKAANPEKVSQIHKRWRAANPEKVREASERWRAENPEKAHEANRKVMERWRKANPEKDREALRRWQEAHPDRVRAYNVASGGKRRAAKAGVPFSSDPAVTDFCEMAGSAASAPCFYCGIDPGPGRRQVDHKIALSHEGGPGHVLDNLAVACGSCNRDKGSMTADEYLASLAYKPRAPRQDRRA